MELSKQDKKIIQQAVNAGARTVEDIMKSVENRMEFCSELINKKTDRAVKVRETIFNRIVDVEHA